MRLCVLDFETANSNMASACSLGILVIEEGVVVKEWVSLIQPHPAYDSFDPFNIKIHHITKEMVKDAPNFANLYAEILEMMEGSILMAHNASFDMTVLNRLIDTYGLQRPHISYIDSLEIARKLYPQLPNHKLNTVCDFLDVNLNHHEALSDAKGSAMIALHAMIDTQVYDLDEFINVLNLRKRRL